MIAVSDRWSFLNDSSILITGATGLIGSALVKEIAQYSIAANQNIKIVAAVRDIHKAETMFDCFSHSTLQIELYNWDASLPLNYYGDVDYLVHAANITSSKDFVSKPVETICSTVESTKAVLQFAQKVKPNAVVYLSSMEVYGLNISDDPLFEDDFAPLNPASIRSSYPESKRLAEALCTAFHAQYGVPVTIVRLAQTIGSDVSLSDNRVFAEFARQAAFGKSIVLLTEGLTARSYLSVIDAVTAILTLLEKGARGQAYNAANEDSYCTIAEMAELVSSLAGIPVKICSDDRQSKSRGFMHTHKLNLCSEKLRTLGWEPVVDLPEMYQSLIASFQLRIATNNSYHDNNDSNCCKGEL
jgi:dTDP-glucose 4,6-dehydratase